MENINRHHYGCPNCVNDTRGLCRHDPPCPLSLPMILHLVEPGKVNRFLAALEGLKMRIDIINNNDFRIIAVGG